MKHRQEGSFDMQHQSQDLSKGATTGKTGTSITTDAATAGAMTSDAALTSAEIERHIAAGKRMQAEAIAAFLSGGFRRLAALFAPRHDHAPVREEHLSRA